MRCTLKHELVSDAWHDSPEFEWVAKSAHRGVDVRIRVLANAETHALSDCDALPISVTRSDQEPNRQVSFKGYFASSFMSAESLPALKGDPQLCSLTCLR
jgi:hypothetical protein